MAQQEGGWRPVIGCTYASLQWFRIAFGSLLTLELVLRFRFLRPFYSDHGTLPTSLLLPKVDPLYQAACLHCHYGQVWHQQVLLSVQVVAALLYTLGLQSRCASILSWYLYLSLTLRNTWLNYILDRYIHYLLFLSMFLPLDRTYSSYPRRTNNNDDAGDDVEVRAGRLVVSPATVALKILVFWIYLDAGYGKYADPLGGWSYTANPLPALDTYARHTLVARYLYALLGPEGLRCLTPVVVYVELLAVPVALLGSYLGSKTIVSVTVGLIWALHVGIALTLRNAALLSLVACTATIPFLPLGCNHDDTTPVPVCEPKQQQQQQPFLLLMGQLVSFLTIGSMFAGNVWLETNGFCYSNSSIQTIWSTVLHNRWNVFVGAEEYVTWEISPGLLQDGSIVDVWGRRDSVDWRLPGSGAPCTATARPGRWRSFPYLAELQGEDAVALWGYLCDEWDRDNRVEQNPGRKLLKFNFFMLQADVLPNMTFSETRKRLIQTYDCVPSQDSQLPYERIEEPPEERKEDRDESIEAHEEL